MSGQVVKGACWCILLNGRAKNGTTGWIMVTFLRFACANLWMLGRQLGLSVTPRSKSYLEILMEEIWQERLKGDPPLGTKIEALKDFKGFQVVIVIERCTDCVAGALKGWAEAIKMAGLSRLVLVTDNSKEQAQQVLKRWQIEAKIVTDIKGEIAKKLNAFFTPRAYIIEDGQLIWKQDKIRVDTKEVVKKVMRR